VFCYYFCQRNHTAELVAGAIFLAWCFKHVNPPEVAEVFEEASRRSYRDEKRRQNFVLQEGYATARCSVLEFVTLGKFGAR
jgi:hypothetical protein